MNKDTEVIELYLSGGLNATDRAAFEARLKTEEGLRAQLDLQSKLRKGIEQASVRADVKAGRQTFKMKKTVKVLGKILLGSALAIALVLGIQKYIKATSTDHVKYETNEYGTKDWAQADHVLPSQVFELNAQQDTVIESKEGILLAIPAEAFVDAAGKPVTGAVEIELKEAMTPIEILTSGLSTTSNGQLLETGGMFYVNARQDGNTLKIANGKSITTDIPNLNPKKDMLLFDGQRSTVTDHEGSVAKRKALNAVSSPIVTRGSTSHSIETEVKRESTSHNTTTDTEVTQESTINWVNPRPFQTKLKARNILSLNFYPPGYLDTLSAMGFDAKNKRLTDSIYYSISCQASDKSLYVSESDEVQVVVAPDTSNTGCEIDPMRIRAIWNKDYNSTILATKEFETRLHYIFKSCSHELLNIYTKDLNRKLFQCDSLAVLFLEQNSRADLAKQFYQFYLEKKGGIAVNEKHLEKLVQLQDERSKTYMAARDSALKKMYANEAITNQEAFEKRYQNDSVEAFRFSKTLQEEIEKNLEEAYRQLGKVKPKIVLPPAGYLSAEIVTLGWKNVDVYVRAATISRTSMKYVDPESYKTAEINYTPLKLSVSNFKEFDRVNAYLLPKSLSSFNRMNELKPGQFDLSLNEFIDYDVVVLGFKGDEVFMAEAKFVKPGELNLKLKKSNRADLKRFDKFETDLQQDIQFTQFELKENKRTSAILKREEITARLRKIVFPCAVQLPAPQRPEMK